MGDNQTGPLDVQGAADAIDAFTDEDKEVEERDEADADVEGDDHGDDTDEDGEPDADEDDEDEESDEESEGKSYTVKIDGKETRVTEKELVSGYQRQADYTRKSMALADERKANEAELAAVKSERQQYAHWANQMLQKLQREAPQEPNWDELRANDPIGFATAWAEHQRYREHQAIIAQQYEAVMAKNKDDEAKALQRTLATEAERLALAIPAWKDESRATQEKAALMSYGKKAGFTEEELGAVYDHRTVLILRKAYLYDRIQSKRPEVAQSRQTPKVAPPASSAPRRHNASIQASKRLAKTGSLNDAAAAMSRFL